MPATPGGVTMHFSPYPRRGSHIVQPGKLVSLDGLRGRDAHNLGRQLRKGPIVIVDAGRDVNVRQAVCAVGEEEDRVTAVGDERHVMVRAQGDDHGEDYHEQGGPARASRTLWSLLGLLSSEIPGWPAEGIG